MSEINQPGYEAGYKQAANDRRAEINALRVRLKQLEVRVLKQESEANRLDAERWKLAAEKAMLERHKALTKLCSNLLRTRELVPQSAQELSEMLDFVICHQDARVLESRIKRTVG